MGDLEGAPAVHFNFPLLSFYLSTSFKTGTPLAVSLFLRNRGGLVIGDVLSAASLAPTLPDLPAQGEGRAASLGQQGGLELLPAAGLPTPQPSRHLAP